MLSVLTMSKKNMFKKSSEYLFKYIKTTPEKKNSLIEPMCCIIRLAILEYKETGTKISIYDNCISYYEPTLVQGMMRTINGDNRDDLHNLFNPLIIALEWYNPTNEFYRKFFERARNGILKLKTAYEYNSIIHHTLNHYTKTIEDTLRKTFKELDIVNSENLECMDSLSQPEISLDNLKNKKRKKGLRIDVNVDKYKQMEAFANKKQFINNTLNKEHNLEDNGLEDTYNDNNDNNDNSDNKDLEENLSKSTIKNEGVNFISVFKGMWSENELNIINSTFNQLEDIKKSKNFKSESYKREIMDTYLNSIELIVRQKEKQVQKIILSTMTSY